MVIATLIFVLAKDAQLLFNSHELLLICMLLNFFNIVMVQHWAKIKKRRILLIMAMLFFVITIAFTVFIVYLGFLKSQSIR